MTQVHVLSEQEIGEKLASFPGWEYKDNKISKQFVFVDFMASLHFINSLAPYCEELDHHPDMHIFYNKVLFELQRFDVGGKVTDKDFLVAQKIEELYIAK
jgi:4a-hydroxytetrahydrobiopterin dehydratase